MGVDVILKNIFGHKDNDHRYEPPRRYDYRDNHASGNRNDGTVVVNNYNTVNVRGDSNNNSNSSNNDNHNQRQDPHKNTDRHR